MLKLSGEVMQGKKDGGIDFDFLDKLAKAIWDLRLREGAEVAVVVGGGNFWRYRDFKDSHLGRVESDYMGMMATVMNSIALASAIKAAGGEAVVRSELEVPKVVDGFVVREAIADLQAGKVVVCAGGSGHPFFTTDSAAALRAAELQCDILMKGTNVDHLYDADPDEVAEAKPLKEVSYHDVMAKNLRVMDLSAIAICLDNAIPVAIFNLNNLENFAKVVRGENPGSMIKK